MAKFDKQQRKTRIKQWRVQEQAAQRAAMPLSPQHLNALLDHLDANLKSCDHTPRMTTAFLEQQGLNATEILPWLGEQGGYCDCEVLLNVEDLAASFQESPSRPTPAPAPAVTRKTPPRDLTNPTGWDFTALPKPWRVANRFAPDQPLRIQLGKNDGCTLTVFETALSGKPMTDDDWTALWYQRTGLPQRSPVQITHAAIELPNQLAATLAQTGSWLPVFCWIRPQTRDGYIEVKTDSRRQRGDLKEVAQLIRQLVEST